jgi:predicted phage baseplate assembly protein
MLWAETPSLYARGSGERVYEIRHADDGSSSVRFGDGIEGSRLPSGDHNIRAIYRKGLGLGGNVASGKLTTLLSRPLGVSGASNPEAASGGEDAEREARARENAPLTVLTLERAVSIRDYQNFARAFAGIAKAHALWIPSGPGRGVFITVAGENGAAIRETSDTYRFLQDALHRYGDPLMPVRILTFRDARFSLRVAVKITADADSTLVLPAVAGALKLAFGFDARGFGQGVSVDKVAAVVHGIAGVEAMQVTELHRADSPIPTFVPRIFATLPETSLLTLPPAAELLLLDETALTLELMP